MARPRNDQPARLATLSPAELKTMWATVFDAPVPALSPELLRHAIAWALQDKTAGGAARRAHRSLTAAVAGKVSTKPSLKPGSQLIRSWNGQSIAVTVTDKGYRYDDRDWPSLSAIARAITGTTWSGPRFFGLRQ